MSIIRHSDPRITQLYKLGEKVSFLTNEELLNKLTVEARTEDGSIRILSRQGCAMLLEVFDFEDGELEVSVFCQFQDHAEWLRLELQVEASENFATETCTL